MFELYEREGMKQIIPGYEPGSGDAEKDRALYDISKIFGGLVPNFHKVLANSQSVVMACTKKRCRTPRPR